MIERVLFVIGMQNAGKSTRLRSMFQDVRFGTAGRIPEWPQSKSIVRLSNDRNLLVRLSSPHERGDSLDGFLSDVAAKTLSGRWNLAGALQPWKVREMPDLKQTLAAFTRRFSPERVRVCFLWPARDGRGDDDTPALMTEVRRLRSVECLAIDARSKRANGLLLADFFDFA